MKKRTILWITTCLISILAVILVSACSTVTKTTQTSTSTMTSANTTTTTTPTTPTSTTTTTTTVSGNTTGTVENQPVASGAANQYNFNLTITSTTAAGITTGQQLLVAASTIDFPNLLTVGATLTGNLDNSPGWWVLKAAGTRATTATPRAITSTTTQLSIDSPLTAQQVHALLQSDPSVVIIDARAIDEYTGVVAAGASVGHILGAYSVPDDGNAAMQLYRFPDKTLPYICYCDTAACAHAGNVATIMILAGYTNVTYMSGGIAVWTAQGYSLVTGG